MHNQINYNLYTRLPAQILSKTDSPNSVLEVKTPHKGTVFIELKKVDTGMFKKASEVSVDIIEIVRTLGDLECEAKNYLLAQWLHPSPTPSTSS